MAAKKPLKAKKLPKDVVIFDLDRTLTKRGTFTPFLLSIANQSPGKLLFIFAVLFQMALYVLKVKSRKGLKEYMLYAFMDGMSRNQTNKRVKEFLTAGFYKKGFHQAGLAEIKRHQKKGHLVGIATASMDFYVEKIVKDMGLDFMIATTSVWERGMLVPMIKGENCYGEEKARRVQVFLAGQKTAQVWFYSDHHTDLPTFALADKRIAVNPTLKLQKQAGKNGCQIVHWK